MIWVLLQSESPWQRNDAITFFIYLCVSLHQESMHRSREYVPAKRNLVHAYKFRIFQKPLDNFFYKFDNPEINCQLIYPASFKKIEIRKGF